MKRKFVAAAGMAMVATLALASCSAGPAAETTEPGGPVTLSVSGWSIATTPEFQLLADGFEEKYPDVTVELKEYDPVNYNTLLTADLAAGSGPDIITQKEVKFVSTF
jgi:multiple sugar transport system substrate-binding protein